jgi:hypothetical protein
MKVIAFIGLFCNLCLANDAIATKKLPTFQEALWKATHDKDGNSHPVVVKVVTPPAMKDNQKLNATRDHHKAKPRSTHKVFFEIVRIREQLKVDEKDRAKGYVASMHSGLYTIESGHLRRLFSQDLKIVPKPGSKMMKMINASAGRFIQDAPLGKRDSSKHPARTWDEVWKQLYLKLRLNEAVPRFVASIILGFIATGMIYLMALMILWVFYKIFGYEPIDNDSSEKLIISEQRRMAECKPLLRQP